MGAGKGGAVRGRGAARLSAVSRAYARIRPQPHSWSVHAQAHPVRLHGGDPRHDRIRRHCDCSADRETGADSGAVGAGVRARQRHARDRRRRHRPTAPAIMEKFIELGGGAGRASSSSCRPPAAIATQDGELSRLRQSRTSSAAGSSAALKNVKMLHTHDPKVADTEEFVKDLRDATRGVVQRRPPVEHRRFLRGHAHLQGVPQGARARRRHRRQLGRRDDSGRTTSCAATRRART